jgi:predicted transposase/invertase (TIGR01784 family)
LLQSGQLRAFYLAEMPEIADAPLGLSILYLIRKEESAAAATASALIARAKQEIGDEALRADLVELIETVIIYKLPRLSREEIQAMLHVHDIRETKVYQEGWQEGKQEGKQEGFHEGLEKGIEKERRRSIAQLSARKMSAQEIADALGLPIDVVLSALNNVQS